MLCFKKTPERMVFMKDFDWELLHELYKNPNLTKVANVLYYPAYAD